jgi:small subunit ribosomal protein S1
MSDMEKPTEPVPAPAADGPGAEPTVEDKKSHVRRMRERRPRPLPEAARMPSLQHEVEYGGKRPVDAFDAEMESLLNEAMEGFDGNELLSRDAGERARAAEPGPKKGKVLRIHGQDIFIDLPGGRTQGVISSQQFPDGLPAIGTEVEVTIEGFDRASGVLLLSRRGAAIEADWSSIEVGQTVEARVTATNKGGLEVDVNGIRGFMPVSQIDLFRVEDLEQFLNQRLLSVVTEADRAERNLVVSRRALLEKEREENREKVWAQLAEGQIYQGIVRSVKDFGAFVDIGGVDGLLHVSELSWQRINDATKVIEPGQSVKVVVLKIDPERRKVSLGAKQLTASPWDNITEKYPSGTVVTGTVSRLMEFGAFVELEPAVEGLIHISELAPQRVRRVIDVVRPGQAVKVAVLSVDPAQRRIGLSLKAALPKEEEAPAAEAVPEPEEPAPPAKPARPRTTPLRGGSSGGLFELPPSAKEDRG